MNITLLLVAPQRPENIGAAARAMNTMGFDHLRLITPCDHLSEPARRVAHGSNNILEDALVFDAFDAAIQDLDFVVGATARRRGKRREYFTGEELPTLLRSKGRSVQNIGIVFGREDRGLLNDEIEKCDALVALTMRDSHPSLNLGQAVMVFCYILSPLVLNPPKVKEIKPGDGEFQSLKKRIQSIFTTIGLDRDSNITIRLLERLGNLSEEDVRLLHSVCSKLEGKIHLDDTVL
jgi:tRNA/rRNA methyltransferase